jgi:hypothetical protein
VKTAIKIYVDNTSCTLLSVLLNMIIKIIFCRDVTLYSPATVSEDHVAAIIRVEEKYDREQSVNIVIPWRSLSLPSWQAITHPIFYSASV